MEIPKIKGFTRAQNITMFTQLVAANTQGMVANPNKVIISVGGTMYDGREGAIRGALSQMERINDILNEE